jgi:hypothetical protein
VPAVIVSDVSCDAWPKVLQIGSALFVRLLLSSNIVMKAADARQR